MSRAQQSQVFNTATANSTQNQNNAQTQFGQNQAQFGTTQQAINNEYANPGYDPATKSAIVNSGMQANNAAFDSLSSEAQNRAARTRNDSSSTALLDDLAMKRAQGASTSAENAQTTIGNAALSDKQKALSDMLGLYGAGNSAYGTSLSGANNALGTANSSANANKGFWDTLGSGFAGALGKGLVPSYQTQAGGGNLSFGG